MVTMMLQMGIIVRRVVMMKIMMKEPSVLIIATVSNINGIVGKNRE